MERLLSMRSRNDEDGDGEMKDALKLNKQEVDWVVGYMQACDRGENYYADPPTQKVVDYIESENLRGKDLNTYTLEILLDIRRDLTER